MRAVDYQVRFRDEQGEYQQLSTEETLNFLASTRGSLGVIVELRQWSYVKTVRTGWLVWHRAEYIRVSAMVTIETDELQGYSTHGLEIYSNHDPDFELTRATDAGAARRKILMPVSIARPGR